MASQDRLDDRKLDVSPDELGDLVVTPPENHSVGMKAVEVSLKMTIGEMGPVRAVRSLLKLNQKGGIDCQSCAWPDPDGKRAMFEFCENGGKAMADEGTKKRVTREFFAAHSIEDLAQRTDYWLNLQGRLTEPMIVRKGATHYEPVTWEEAFDVIAENLNSLASPDEAIFYTSGRTSNEAAFLYQLFVRQFGTNNLPDCSNMCHESTSVGLAESIGLGKASVTLEDLGSADLIINIGQNPGTNSPRMLSTLQEAKRRGAKMIAVNPLPEAGLLNFINPNPHHYRNPLDFAYTILTGRETKLADVFLPIKIGGDEALIKGMMKVLWDMEKANPGTVFDHAFINEYTTGYEEFLKELEATSWDDILTSSGLEMSQIVESAEMFAAADRVITCWAMGVTQHKNSVAVIQDIANLHFLRGQIGKPGAGLCPVRGHSNVQGDRTMGIWERPYEPFIQALEKEFKFTASRVHGFNAVNAISAMAGGRAKTFFAMGGNFLSAAPDTDVVFDGLKSCKLTAYVVTKLNRSMVATGDVSLILPCLGRSEIDIQASGPQFVTTESTMSNVQVSEGILKPASEHLRSEPWIVARMAKTVLGDRSTVDWDAMAGNYDNIRDSIERTISGFENYNARVRVPGGFYLPNPPRERVFNTATGKATFFGNKLDTIKVPDGCLLLSSIRSHSQYNSTVYENIDRYRGIHGGRRVILMNKDDIADRNLKQGSVVDITGHWEDGERHIYKFIVVPYPIPKGCAAAYYPEMNPLVPLNSNAIGSMQPASKSVVISLRDTGETAGKFELE